MTAPQSERSKDKAASSSYELDPLAESHPALSRICNAWEQMNLAVDKLPRRKQIAVYRELARRMEERVIEWDHQLAREENPLFLDQLE